MNDYQSFIIFFFAGVGIAFTIIKTIKFIYSRINNYLNEDETERIGKRRFQRTKPTNRINNAVLEKKRVLHSLTHDMTA